ncbi:hypothetical protein [Macrococcus armenti]|uniref:hypothetical protein n=1 Tax=Macrococcus armenti TaxID=2875764 RepID=UPI001CCDBC80|nr:hypothetical protein [Macrococcus armenti]UBH12631.1 hypothetical protein LAU43_08655 [Macrococcus armenti]UBH21790.1 hypothetical protein LAU42_08320 [Macrococcus armenti]
MWNELNLISKEKYKKMILNFASLSELFTQKINNKNSVTPIVNSKFQETVFQKSFNAVAEDIANTSYDASLISSDKRYLIGIKSFGYESGDQKIAQFKANSENENWEQIFTIIKNNAKKVGDKIEADTLNESHYLNLAHRISYLRNLRIASSREQIKGFQVNTDNIESIYHVLMPYKNNGRPLIYVGEIEYDFIDIENIKILGATSLSKPNNFKFTDGKHTYKYTSADSQLYMSFNNKEIIKEQWNVEYARNPFEIFESLGAETNQYKESDIEQTVSWVLYDEDKTIPEYSGMNAFNSISKNASPKVIKKFIEKYESNFSISQKNYIENELNKILLKNYRTTQDKKLRSDLRNSLLEYINQFNNLEIKNDIEKLVYRDADELYIRIPYAKRFHNNNPDFFGKGIGLLDNKNKLVQDKKNRVFKLEFISSGDVIKAYINQESGKAIQSYQAQNILGKWLKNQVFQLKDRELLTYNKLLELKINGVRFIKYKDQNRPIGLEYIWIDEKNPPSDAIGWVSKNKIH